MDPFNYQKHVQGKILEALKDKQDPDWHKQITQLDPDIVIWFLKELVEKREYVDRILVIAKIYAQSENPKADDKDVANKKIEKGEEIRYLTTERGNVCWLLAAIAATFRTEFYPEIISILEKLAFDPVYYVRIQATVPLSFFAKNIRARKHHDETPFEFKDEDRQRVINLSFRMLREHRDLPRVLEGVVRMFDSLRLISDQEARQVVEYFFYNSKEEMQPQYLTHQAVPLLIFFAEFRSGHGGGFNDEWFQGFAKELLKKTEEEAPYVRSTFVWHIWKEIQNDPQNYQKFKKYIPLLLHEDFELQSLHQYEFLVKEVIKISPRDGLELFQKQLAFVAMWAHKYNIRDYAPWLLDVKEIVERIAKESPDHYLGVLSQITQIVSSGAYVGDILPIFRAYLLIPDKEKQEELRPDVLRLYETVKPFFPLKELPESI